MTGTVILLRWGYPTPIKSLLISMCLSLLVVNISGLTYIRRWYASGYVSSLIVLLILWTLGFFPLPIALTGAKIFGILGIAAFGRNLLSIFISKGFVVTSILLMLGMFLGLYLQGSYWGLGQQHDILYPEAIATRSVHIDVAEQAAVVSMISTYRVASTGLDGLVKLRYHNGSFWLAESLRQLCGLSSIEFVAFAYGIFTIPFYVGMFLQFAHSLRINLFEAPAKWPIGSWFIAVLVIIGLVPYESNFLRANFNILIINSDSFMLGLALVFLFGGLFLDFYRQYPHKEAENSAANSLVVLVVLPAMLVLIGIVKISLLYSILTVLGYLWWRIRGWTNWALTVGMALSFIALAFLLRIESGANKSVVALFNFDRIHPEWIPYFFLGHFIWTWILAIFWARRFQIATVFELRQAFFAKSSLPLESVVFASFASLVPYFVIFFYSAAWVYFTLFPALIGGAILIALQDEWDFSSAGRQMVAGDLPLARILIFSLGILVSAHLVVATVSATYRMLHRNGQVRALLAGKDSSTWFATLKQIGHPPSPPDPALRKPMEVLTCLSRIAHWPEQQRRGMVLYIPKTNRWYWDMRQSDSGVISFIAPAMSGLAMVDGLPEYNDVQYAAVGWGYPEYNLPTSAEMTGNTQGQVVMTAREFGFRELLIFTDVNDSGCKIDDLPLTSVDPRH